MELTNEQYVILKKHEKHLRRGYYGDYVYGLYQKDFDELHKIYKELGGNERLKYNCNMCILRLTKFLGKFFFDSKPELNTLPTEVIEAVLQEHIEEQPVEDKPEDKPKKKRTTKKKTTKKTTKKEGK